jgi:formylglycine-generating enzyme required for sulfatase activity
VNATGERALRMRVRDRAVTLARAWTWCRQAIRWLRSRQDVRRSRTSATGGAGTSTSTPLLLGRHPVTQGEYNAITGASQSGEGDDALPVVDVSWLDAVDFCNLLSDTAGFARCYLVDGEEVTLAATADGFRLPTEAEWEYACRAGSDGVRYGELDEIAWHRGNSGHRLHQVGGKQPNPWRLYEMIGNVWEWCWDIFDPEIYGPYRVLRGGGWCDPPNACRAACRRRSHPTFHIDDVGFRLARST